MLTHLKSVLSIILVFLLFNGQLSAQSFSVSWPFTADSLPHNITGNVTARGVYIDRTLFNGNAPRAYGTNGLTGTGTTGVASPTCKATYDSVGTISPYMEMSLSPNTGHRASLDAFSFKIKAGTIGSANMVIAAGYSTNNGLSFTGFNISKNTTPITPAPGTTGTPLATNDSLVLSAPAITINAGDTLKIRIIYWKNNNSNTANNPITIGSVTLTGTTVSSSISIPAPSSLSGFNYAAGSGPSAERSFIISGSGLTGNLVVTAPASYEVSSTSGSGFTSSVSLVPGNGGVLDTIYVQLKSGLAQGTYDENITITSSGATSQTVRCTGTVTAVALPSIVVAAPASLTGFTYQASSSGPSGPSAEKSINISASNLTADLTITAPSSYEVSKTSGSGFGSTARFTPTTGNVSGTIYVRLKADLSAGTYNENITASSTDAADQTIACAGTVTPPPPPALTATPASLTGMNYVFNSGPSTAQSISISGSNLSGNVTVTAVSNFEVSLSAGTGYSSSVTAPAAAGSITAMVYVRLKAGLAVGPYNENVSIASSGITRSVSCSGNVTSILPPNGFTAIWYFANDTLAQTNGNVSAAGAHIDRSLFTTSRVPGPNGLRGAGTAGLANHPSCNSTYDSAGTITPYMEMYVTPNSGYSASLDAFSFKIKADSITSTMVISAGYSTNNGLSFTGFNITKYTTPPTTPTTSTPGTTGTALANFDSLVLSAPALTINAGDTLKIRIIYWKNGTNTTSKNPITIGTVSLSGTTAPVAATPNIASPSPAALTGWSYVVGSGPSSVQSFIVYASGLTTDLTATAPASYEISRSASTGFAPSLIIPRVSGVVSSTIIYARLKANLAVGTYNENIDITSTGANTRSVSCQGTVTALPPALTVTPTTLSGFTYQIGNGPSTQQTLTVGGTNLTGNVTITAGTNYEVSSTSGSGFTSSVTLTPVTGTVSNTMVYVRLKAGLAIGTYNGSIVVSTSGANNSTVAVSGSVTAETCPTLTAYVAEKGTTINGTVITANFTIQGTADATVTYNINGGASMVITLTSGTALIQVDSVTANVQLNLTSIAKGACSNPLADSSIIEAHPIVLNSTPDVNGFNTYPNPSSGGQLKIKMTDTEAGQYKIHMTTTSGQVIYSMSIDHLGGSAVYKLNYGNMAAKGIYYLEIINVKKQTKSVQSIIIAD